VQITEQVTLNKGITFDTANPGGGQSYDCNIVKKTIGPGRDDWNAWYIGWIDGAGGTGNYDLATLTLQSGNTNTGGQRSALYLVAGNSIEQDNPGGDIHIRPGLGNGTGSNGHVYVSGSMEVLGATNAVKTPKFQMTSGSTNGYVLTSDTAGVAHWAPASGGSGMTWGGRTSSGTIAVNNGYISVANAITMTLPTTSAMGDAVELVGESSLWTIGQNDGQQIFFNKTSTDIGAFGAFGASDTKDAARLICIVANNTWNVVSFSGSPGVIKTGVKGYFGGGYTNAASNTAEKITFSNDTSAAVTTATLTAPRHDSAGLSNGSTKGYFGGGWSSGTTYFSASDKITFSNDTTSALTTAGVGNQRQGLVGVSNRSTKGYYAGGILNGTWGGAVDTVTFATDIGAYNPSGLTQARFDCAGVTDGSTKGYIVGGYTSYTVTVVTTDKITYSSDTTGAQTTANLPAARGGCGGVSEGQTKGYVLGGDTGSGTNSTAAYKITFSTDACAAVTTANLSAGRRVGGALSQGSSKGYYAGGYTTANTAQADILTYSSDTTAAQTTANLSVARANPAGLSDVGL
jgi:hypothetical protein